MIPNSFLSMQWPLAHLSGAAEYAFKTSDEMRNNGVRPEEVTQSV